MRAGLTRAVRRLARRAGPLVAACCGLLVLAAPLTAPLTAPVAAQEAGAGVAPESAATQGGSQEPARAQTLADIRQDLTVLNVEIQRLKRELSTTSGPAVPGGATLLDRVTLIESALQRLTARTEELEFRIARIVEDGTNRIGDLEFRLVELEGGDVSQLGETSTLGGEEAASAPPAPAPAPAPPAGGEVAVGEAADFEAAQALLEAGDAAAAAAAFQRFTETYPGGPFAVPALMGRGDALAAMGDTREAARAYLAAYNAAPEGTSAPAALLALGGGLNDLGQVDAACQILAQLQASFPGAEAAGEAASTARSIGCP